MVSNRLYLVRHTIVPGGLRGPPEALAFGPSLGQRPLSTGASPHINSRGSANLPFIAVAAAVAGLTK